MNQKQRQNRNPGLVLLAVLCLAILPLTIVAAGAGVVEGTVQDAGGRPVAGAVVRLASPLWSQSTRTGTDGRYRFEGVPAGSYELEVRREGYRLFTQKNVEVVEGKELSLPVKLQALKVPSTPRPAPTQAAARAAPVSTDAPADAVHRRKNGGPKKKARGYDRGRAEASTGAPRLMQPVSPEPEMEERTAATGEGWNTEAYDQIVENPFHKTVDQPLSTFSIDVDTASYSNMRRMLKQGRLPPKGAVRLEELINYFTYDYPQPEGDAPFSVTTEMAASPWALEHRLLRIGLKGRSIPEDQRSQANLVFLLDVSGSMNRANKLPLLKSALKMLVANLSNRDRVAIAVYAGASGLVLPSTPCDDRQRIVEALDRLRAGGSTNAGSGIELAYKVAEKNFIKGGVNRVILATDGDFNVGTTSQSALVQLIEQKARSGVFLSVLGFGMGNYKDSTLEKLADKGNGNYAYIDTEKEARKVLVEEMGATLVTIAKDVKLQLEFNPAVVDAYRLIGYENRLLRARDFNDDTKDAGEIGAGHTVTALYEIVPAGSGEGATEVDALKYQKPRELSQAAAGAEWLTVKLRYKAPDADVSQLLTFPVIDAGKGYEAASEDFQFAAAVAAFGMLLRDSKYSGTASFEGVLELGDEGRGADRNGYRAEFLELVRRAKELKR